MFFHSQICTKFGLIRLSSCVSIPTSDQDYWADHCPLYSGFLCSSVLQFLHLNRYIVLCSQLNYIVASMWIKDFAQFWPKNLKVFSSFVVTAFHFFVDIFTYFLFIDFIDSSLVFFSQFFFSSVTKIPKNSTLIHLSHFRMW